jgi:hypothetical protein
MTWVTVLTLTLAGCGTGPPREPVSGKVMIDGKPLDEGEIYFAPTAGAGPTAGGKIENGDYALPSDQGPASGPHQVLITSTQPTGRKLVDEDDTNVKIDEIVETIPGRYNDRSELKVDVKAGGNNAFDFDLKGRIDPTKAPRLRVPRRQGPRRSR